MASNAFIPFHSPKGTVDVGHAEDEYRKAIEGKVDLMRRITVRWVPVMQEIANRRPDMHWCAYDDGYVVAFVTLERHESFGDLEDIYQMISEHVRHLERLGSYKGKFVSEPDPEDDTSIGWRVWKFKAGDSALHINCSFSFSQHCKVVVDGTETVTVEKKRVVCGETAEDLAA